MGSESDNHSIAHGNQKVRAKNSRNEEDSPKMPVETLK